MIVYERQQEAGAKRQRTTAPVDAAPSTTALRDLTDHRARLVALYTLKQPEKLYRVDKLLRKCAASTYPDMFALLEEKYGVATEDYYAATPAWRMATAARAAAATIAAAAAAAARGAAAEAALPPAAVSALTVQCKVHGCNNDVPAYDINDKFDCTGCGQKVCDTCAQKCDTAGCGARLCDADECVGRCDWSYNSFKGCGKTLCKKKCWVDEVTVCYCEREIHGCEACVENYKCPMAECCEESDDDDSDSDSDSGRHYVGARECDDRWGGLYRDSFL